MTDIDALVERLRDIAHGMNAARNQATLREAAEEIERLRAALEATRPKTVQLPPSNWED